MRNSIRVEKPVEELVADLDLGMVPGNDALQGAKHALAGWPGEVGEAESWCHARL